MSDAPDFHETTGRERDTSLPRFYIKAIQNNARSEEDGVPRFDDVEFVEILIPGDRKTTWDGMVKPEHRQRWPSQYAAFKADSDAPLDGTPIGELPGMTRSQAEELIFQHVKTIEILAALPDDKAMKVVSMGGLGLRDRARRYLDTTAGAAKEEKLAAENRQKDDKIAALESKVADLVKIVESLPQPSAQSAPGA